MDDKSIVRLFLQRSESAISETAKKFGRYCFKIAYNILANHEDAEECVNDTYNTAWNSIPPSEPPVLSVFLGRITRQAAIDKFRYRNAEKRGGGEMPLVLDELHECIPDITDTECELEKNRLAEVMKAFITSLPSTEKKIFLCRYWYMKSISEIAMQFDFSQSKVKSMLFRTRNKLRQKLIKEGFL